MKVTINKSTLKGTVGIPSSKSMTIRGLMCAALSRGASEIVHPLVSEDTDAAAQVLGKIGVGIEKEKDVWRVTGGSLRAAAGELNCGESATTMRFMIAICALIPGTHKLVGGPSLSNRPVKSLVDVLRQLGIKSTLGGKNTPPVTITGGTMQGQLAEIPGNVSSQFISALLLISPFTEKELTIKLTTPLTSAPYVAMTIWCLKKFGIDIRHEDTKFVVRPQKYVPARLEVEGDWTSASYFLGLGACSKAGITVENLSAGTLQGDRVMLDFLCRMGAVVLVKGNSVTVKEGKLRALCADLSDCIDLLPTMAVLAALADGKSEFTGIERARIKESNRVAAVREGLQKLGVDVTEAENKLTIVGLKTTQKVAENKGEADLSKTGEKDKAALQNREPVMINSHSDHRIAMAFGMFGAVEGGVIIDDAECVAKTFPEFWEALSGVGGDLRENG
jgi:3-phosphoshikimate 1-carboxyvinyltransferase